MYHCYEWDESLSGRAIVNTKNYKYKKGVPSLLSFVVLRLFNFLKIPSKLELFRKEVNVEEELEFVETLDMSKYKQCLNSDLTILLGISLLKNPRL
jgi:hypothetical protein